MPPSVQRRSSRLCHVGIFLSPRPTSRIDFQSRVVMAISPEPAHTDQQSVRRFGGFELDLRTGDLSGNGTNSRLQGQPLQLLELLLQQPGQLVTRDHIQRHLWPDGTVVEFEHSVNAAVKRLRTALGDDAEKPTFIETIPAAATASSLASKTAASPVGGRRRTHCFSSRIAPTLEPRNKRRFVVMAVVAASLMVAAVAARRFFFARPVLTDTDVILVASFVNKTGDPIFDNSLDKALEIKLTESPFLSLFPEADVRRDDGYDAPRSKRARDPGTGDRNLQTTRAQSRGGAGDRCFRDKYLITLEAIDARNQKSIALREEEAESKDR